ncbi:MAG TPA: STAS domain-containing protein [Gammaproteobacteria bacterium]|nr:STAS domain-containing protein [Gammaproteobacteria bacterium]
MDKVEFHSEGNGLFKVRGRMNFESCPAALDDSMHLFADLPRVELDFSDVTQVDSAGLALLVEWAGWARRRHRDLEFRRVPLQALALARISDVESMLPVR